MDAMTKPQLTAHYFTGQRNGEKIACVAIGTAGDISGDRLVDEIIVSGKREARKIAAECGAECWNF